MVIVGRPINGISLNGLEFLCEKDGTMQEFVSEESARKYLKMQGVNTEELDSLVFEEVTQK